MLPVSIAVGVIGTQLEGYFGEEKTLRDNTDFPAAWERREIRQLQEIASPPSPTATVTSGGLYDKVNKGASHSPITALHLESPSRS